MPCHNNNICRSAIIAALQISLGMGARQTHRGTNLSSLIRSGAKGDARVAVTIHNTGELAYLPDEFGDSITVERILKHNGSSAYVLKTADNKVKSRKKHDIDDVIEHFHLYVGNPCCILDQENSKLFLKGNEKDKYQFFLKASLLQSMENEYAEEKHTRQSAKEELDRRSKNMGHLEQEVTTARLKLEEMQQMGKFEERKAQLNKEYMWCGALGAEELAEKQFPSVGKQQKKLESAKVRHVFCLDLIPIKAVN
jgi:chromosome segregation ATPase